MASNLYFAYSIKREFDGLVSLLPTVLPPILEKKKKKTRACDACSVRKTKCDESRPCSHCVNNNLECTELRQRKKLGPKNLRKKTIDSIHLILKDSHTQSPEHYDGGNISDFSVPVLANLADFAGVADYVKHLSPELLLVLAPFTVAGFHGSVPDILLSVSSPVGGSSLADYAKRLAACSYVLVVIAMSSFSASKVDESSPVSATMVQSRVLLLYSDCARLLVFRTSHELDFDCIFYLSLAELHLYAFSRLSLMPSRELIHLKSAISQYQLLAALHGKDNSQVRELYQLLYVWERHAYLFSVEQAFRISGVQLNATPPKVPAGSYSYQTITEVYRQMLHALDELRELQLVVPEPSAWTYQGSISEELLSYSATKLELREILEHLSCTEAHLTAEALALKFAVGLKAIQMSLNEMSQQRTALELLELIQLLNAALDPNGPDLRLFIHAFGIIPQMLEALRSYLLVTTGEQLAPHSIDVLLQISSYISFYSGHTFKLNDPILTDWFSRLIGPQTGLFLEGVLNE